MPDESAIIQRVLAGDGAAFEMLVAEHQHRVFNLVFRMVRDRETALDLTQEVFIRVFKRISALKEKSKLGSWIMQVTHNLTLDHIKKRRVDAFSADFGDQQVEQMVHGSGHFSPPENPEEAVLRMTPGTLTELVDQLDIKYRTVLILRFVEGHTFNEIARVMGLPLATVKFRKHYAMKLLREKWLRTPEGKESGWGSPD